MTVPRPGQVWVWHPTADPDADKVFTVIDRRLDLIDRPCFGVMWADPSDRDEYIDVFRRDDFTADCELVSDVVP